MVLRATRERPRGTAVNDSDRPEESPGDSAGAFGRAGHCSHRTLADPMIAGEFRPAPSALCTDGGKKKAPVALAEAFKSGPLAAGEEEARPGLGPRTRCWMIWAVTYVA